MIKKDLIELVASKTGLTKADSGKAVAAVLESISESLVKGEDCSLIGFGSFQVRDRAERQGRNPANGETITIPATRSVRFSVGKTLKNDVANAKK